MYATVSSNFWQQFKEREHGRRTIISTSSCLAFPSQLLICSAGAASPATDDKDNSFEDTSKSISKISSWTKDQ